MPRKKYMGKKPKNVVPEPNVPFYDKEGNIIGYRELDKPPEPKFAGGGIASGMRRFNRGGKV